jgi:hypothetical protein
MQGVVRGSGEQIVLNYEQGMDTDFLTTTIDEEKLEGKAVMRGASSFTGNAIGSDGSHAALYGSTTTGDVIAKLIGDKGSTLSCDLQYADSSGFTTSGGVGVCKHSDGRIIDVIW